MLETLKIIKYHRKSKFELTNTDFNNIFIVDVFFDEDILFILPPVETKISYAYGKTMDGMENIYDGHARCIHIEFGLIF